MQQLKAFVRTDRRTVLAFFISPLVGPLLLSLAEGLTTAQSNVVLHLVVGGMAGAFCLCVSLLLAFPLYLIVRRVFPVNLISCIVAGGLIGAGLPLAVTGSPYSDLVAGGIAYGVAVATVFWIIGVSGWALPRANAVPGHVRAPRR